MKYMFVGLLLSCVTTNPYAYEEATECPVAMNQEEHLSGQVRCRAMCSSYGRDMDSYRTDCKCFCKTKVVTY